MSQNSNQSSNQNSNPTVLELFSGCGGVAIGLHRAGFRHLACVEWDKSAAATLRAAGMPVIQGDVREVDYTPYIGKTDLLWASPPCQAGSTAGRRKGAQDERNGWPWTLDVIDTVKPRVVLTENVLGWTYHREGCDRRGHDLTCIGCYWNNEVIPAFRKRYAHVGVWLCNAANYGVPQTRRRVLLWASHTPLPADPPPPTHLNPDEGQLPDGVQPWKTLRQTEGVEFHRRSCRSEGGERFCYPCDADHGRACTEPWRLDRPAPTVVTTEVKGTRAFAPEWTMNGGPALVADTAFLIFGGRRITEDEAAILQAFPRNWPFQGTSEAIYRQIGNAVPPPLAEAAGRVIFDLLRNQKGMKMKIRREVLDVMVADHKRRLDSALWDENNPNDGLLESMLHPVDFVPVDPHAVSALPALEALASSCPLCAAAANATEAAPPISRARPRINRAAVARLPGGDRYVDALPAAAPKASGRPSANASVMWKYFTTSVYQSGDLPVLATREALQNSVDAIKAAIRAKQIKAQDGTFHVAWYEERNVWNLSWDDNGIGMDADTILTKFLTIGESGKRGAANSGEAAGGFGVAKAVILGVSETFKWEMHSRDNLAVADGADADVQVFAEEPRQGTQIRVHDVATKYNYQWDYARQTHLDARTRIIEMLAANDLPDIEIVFNGEVVSPMFSRRGGSRVPGVPTQWGLGTEATVKAHRRAPGDKGGAYYIRLNGLFQFKKSSRRGGMKADVVIDLNTTVRPGEEGYPLNAARDAFQANAGYKFEAIVEEVERENESLGRENDDVEVIDPEQESEELAALGEMAAAAFGDTDFQRAMAEAAGGITDYYEKRLAQASKEEAAASAAPRGTRASPTQEDEDGTAPRQPVVSPGFKAAATLGGGLEGDIAVPGGAATSSGQAVQVIRTFLQGADTGAVDADPNADRTRSGQYARGVFGPLEQSALDTVADADANPSVKAEAVQTIERAIEKASELAMKPGGGGLMQLAVIPKMQAALAQAAGVAVRVRNPFGKHAGIRINKKAYDAARARRFKKGYARWMPYLVVWDACLRLISNEARIRRAFKPGFVLDDGVLGLTDHTPGKPGIIYIHPDRFAQTVKAHRERPIAIASYLHGIACHELTHIDSGRLHAKGHDERFVVGREDLGMATGHLLPALAVLVQKVLGLPDPQAEQKKHVSKLEKEAAGQRERASVHKAREQACERSAAKMRKRLAELEAEAPDMEMPGEYAMPGDAPGERAARPPVSRMTRENLPVVLVDRIEAAIVQNPPQGVDAAYVGGFFARNRTQLEGMLRAQMAPMLGGARA